MRYMTEDLPHGLAVLRNIAELCNVKTPMMDTVRTSLYLVLQISFYASLYYTFSHLRPVIAGPDVVPEDGQPRVPC